MAYNFSNRYGDLTSTLGGWGIFLQRPFKRLKNDQKEVVGRPEML